MGYRIFAEALDAMPAVDFGMKVQGTVREARALVRDLNKMFSRRFIVVEEGRLPGDLVADAFVRGAGDSVEIRRERYAARKGVPAATVYAVYLNGKGYAAAAGPERAYELARQAAWTVKPGADPFGADRGVDLEASMGR